MRRGCVAMENLSDKELVALLWEGDSSAWEYIHVKCILAVLRRSSTSSGSSFYRIIQDRQLNEISVLSILFEDMIAKRKLENFQYKCSLIYWMRFYVIKAIFGYCRKNPPPVSDEWLEGVSTPDTRSKAELEEIAQLSFRELWRKNPMRAYVYALKKREKCSSTEIMGMLALSSANNVDKCFSRASADMLEILRKYMEER